jgi:PAS domain-containing protein
MKKGKNILELTFSVLAAILAGASIAVGLLLFSISRPKTDVLTKKEQGRSIRIVLMKGTVTDISDLGLIALGLTADNDIKWRDVHTALSARFPELLSTPPDASVLLTSDDGATLEITVQNDLMQIEMRDAGAHAADRHRVIRLQHEAELLRAALNSAPDTIWFASKDGGVSWGNPAYQSLSSHSGLPVCIMQSSSPNEVRRIRVNETEEGSRRWFDLRSVPHENGTLNYATDVESVVQAEIAQRNFVQTLSKTFAHLPIGLAIFDRDRQLALFNPALIDLTALPAQFMTSRPNLLTFFDTLREARMMPEPKNYSSWREQLAVLVRAACDDRYSETWTLPSGLTYKVTGRPHPDGAIAFLIEDISAEISLTRRFRAELSQSQAALDTVDDAIAVFSHLGVLTMSNQAYRNSWGTDATDAGFLDINIVDELRRWQAACGPSPIWVELRNQVMGEGNRTAWSAIIQHMRLGQYNCCIMPIVGGDTLLRFRCIEQSVGVMNERVKDLKAVQVV